LVKSRYAARYVRISLITIVRAFIFH
jgi:hypothetical protein